MRQVTMNLSWLHSDVVFEGEEISNETITALWNKFKIAKSMPKILAYNVPKEDFFMLINIVKHEIKIQGLDPSRSEIEEYGNVDATDELKVAFSAYAPTMHAFLIFRRIDSVRTLETDLKHELKHIYLKLKT